MSPDIAASVRARLLRRAKERGEEFEFTLARFAAERLLYRLGASAARERCILKGASLLSVWHSDPYRATRDVDVLASGPMDDAAVRSLVQEICAVPCPEDGLRFDLSDLTIETIRPEDEYAGKRARFRAFLGNARIAVQLDLGVGDAVAVEPEEITYPTLLSSLPAPRLRAYPREAMVAEKFEAMVTLDVRNSRMKDFHDVWALSDAFAFEGSPLRRAVAACFERRGTSWSGERPRVLTPAFYQAPERAARWRSYLAAGAVLVPPPAQFERIGERIIAFLGPVRASIVTREPFEQTWPPRGPWRPGRGGPGMNRESTVAAVRARPRFKPYPAYKDSGVEWLGEIPAHWEVKPLKFAVIMNPEVLEETTDPNYEILYVDVGNVDSTGNIQGLESLRFENAPTRARRKVREHDVVLSTVRTYLTAIALVQDPPDNLIVSTGFAVLRARQSADPKFLWRVVQSGHFIDAVVSHSEGVGYPAINPSRLGRLVVWLPPLPEQRAIAAFLDRETAKIDALIAKKERLIELLQEKRTALITRAVTKGLDPNVPMKDSGVEWLGEIPAHWEVAPVYARYEVALGKMLDAKRVTGEFSGPYLRNVDVQWDMVNTEGLPEMDFAPWERDRYSLRPGDLLVCEGGEVGRTAMWRGGIEPCFYQKALHRVRPRANREVPRFFFYLMYMVAKCGVFAGVGNQNTIDHLTAVQLKHYRFPFAPEPEQRAIAAFLDRETAKIDALIAKVREAIQRLREYRTALISAAVTGKIDVREELHQNLQEVS